MSEDAEKSIPPCFDCAENATERLIEMFVGIVQKKRIARCLFQGRRLMDNSLLGPRPL